MNKAASLGTLVATSAALVLLGVVLAYWTWAWLAPAAVPRAPAVETLGGTSPAAGALFRVAGDGAAAAPTGVRLMGVVAATDGKRGHAVLRLEEKKTVAVPEGAEIEPGLRLAEVHADRIVLERNGTRETLAWPEKKGK